MTRPLTSARAPSSLRSAFAKAATSLAGVTASRGRCAKSSRVPSTSRNRATGLSLVAAKRNLAHRLLALLASFDRFLALMLGRLA